MLFESSMKQPDQLIAHGLLASHVATRVVTLDLGAVRLPGCRAKADSQGNQHRRHSGRHPTITLKGSAEDIPSRTGTGSHWRTIERVLDIALQCFHSRISMLRLPADRLGHDRVEVSAQHPRRKR